MSTIVAFLSTLVALPKNKHAEFIEEVQRTYHRDTISLGVHDEGNDETVETQDFGENKDENLCIPKSINRNICFRADTLTIPTKSLGCCAVPLTPASPTIPIAKPAARPARPTESPAPS